MKTIHFVGAGSGAADLITLRGKQYLEEADTIIYAGSLVNPQLLDYAKAGCSIYNSASMTLEEVIDVMKQAEEKKERAPRHRQENKGPIRPADIDWSASSSDSLSFEDKLSKFKQDSDEKMQTLRRNNDSKRSGGYSRKNTHSF